MGIVHFLNVNSGDCSIVQHPSGRATVIDVCNARKPVFKQEEQSIILKVLGEAQHGNFHQKGNPVNPIEYMQARGIEKVFRFILTHPDMDHMDGIKDFFDEFRPTNFWDTDNTKSIDSFNEGGGFKEEDWLFYKGLRDNVPNHNPKRLALFSGHMAQFFNRGEDGSSGGDGLQILAPTSELVACANGSDDFNDCSYVLLYQSAGGRILFGGDSHDRTWEHILSEHRSLVKDVDVLIAPHHGRKSSRSYEFLDVLRPKLTLFGNAPSQHLAYNAWSDRGLPKITNNQAGSIILDTNTANQIGVYVTNEVFARKEKSNTFFAEAYGAWYIGHTEG